VAKLVARLLATTALWIRIPTSKIQNGKHKQRSGQHSLACQKISSQLSIVDIQFKGVLDKIMSCYLSAGVEGGKRAGTLVSCLSKFEPGGSPSTGEKDIICSGENFLIYLLVDIGRSIYFFTHREGDSCVYS
jgi:hypothetical protein